MQFRVFAVLGDVRAVRAVRAVGVVRAGGYVRVVTDLRYYTMDSEKQKA